MTLAIGLAAIHHDPAMTLGLGVVLVVANRAAAETPVIGKGVVAGRTSSLLLPVALLTQLIGFSGIIRRSHAVMLVIEGIAIAPLCVRMIRPRDVRVGVRVGGVVQLMLSIGLIALSGWAAVTAVANLAEQSELFRPAIANSLVLGPVVVLPMIPLLATMAENGMATAALETLVLFVLLNLCGVLPAIAAVHPGMTIPMLSWRLDSLLLVVIGLLLLPPAIGRWTLGKREGLALMACFVAYLMITLIATLG
jgi:hypothetical protein